MARKTKKQIEEEQTQKKKTHKITWVFIDIAACLLMFFSMSKMGVVGILLNNIFTLLFGSLYLISLISIFLYGVFYIFFKEKYKAPVKLIAGIILLNITIMMLLSYISNDINTYGELGNDILTRFKNIVINGNTTLSGGLIGNVLYITFQNLFNNTGALIVMVVLAIISIVLLIPTVVYKNAIASAKQNREDRKKQKQLEKERRKEELQRQKEEASLKLAQEMNSQYEEPKFENIEADIQEPTHASVLSTKSKYFINLNENEIKANSEETDSEQTQEVKETIVTTTKVNKVRKTNGTYRIPRNYEEFFEPNNSKSSNINKNSAKIKGEKVIDILNDFEIEATLLNTYIGPSVTKFEIKPSSTVKVNKIMNISDNIKMELAAKDIRIEAPIPGRSAVGIEIPNVEPIPVKMLELMKSLPADKRNERLLFALGKDLMGKPVYCNLAKMPHLLIAGATGSGKSVCINTILTSFLMRTNPDDVKLVLVDPKRVEFTPYHDIPHLLWPVITDATMASNMLKKIVVIMQERYEAFASIGVREINSFNDQVLKHNASLKDGEEPLAKMPYIVVIIDELADLMAIAKKDVELSIQRITQLARASGIHLIVATQRPSTDVITGLIKSNIPSRISFAVASSIDSRTILDATGAERLLGNGDMLYYPQGENAPIRLQGVYVTDGEINKVTQYVKSQAEPQYEDSYFEFLTNMNGTTVANASNAESNDSLYDEVVEFVKMRQAASTSLLQRRFGIGYNRAARLIDTLEDRGIIGPANGSKPREVYIKKDEE